MDDYIGDVQRAIGENGGVRTFILKGISSNETISIDNLNQVITSSSTSRQSFGDNFNKVWVRLLPGENTLTVNGSGQLTIKYRLPLKVGDF